MKLGANDKDKIIRFGVIGGGLLVVVIYGYLQLRTPDVPAPAAAPVVIASPARSTSSASVKAPSSPGAVPKSTQTESAAPNATRVATTAAQYDPTLHMEPMLVAESLVYSGSGRNIFSASSAPAEVNIPKPVAPVRTTAVTLPVYTAPTGPPPPPPIDLKFFGTATRADGSRQAFLLHGEDVFLAAPGNIVQRRYKIGAISANSVEVEDLTNNNKQSLPLQKN
jgi:hypothetical protein